MSTQPVTIPAVEEKIESSLAVIDISRVLAWSGKKIRIFGTSNKPWFHGTDLAKALGYSDFNGALTDHVKERNKLIGSKIPTLGKTPSLDRYEKQAYFVNEAGMYALIMQSKKKEAEAFQDWVTDEVLPSIRKTGSYQLNEQLKTLQCDLSNQRLITDQSKKEAEEARAKAEIEQKRAENAEAESKAKSAKLNRLHNLNVKLVSCKKLEGLDGRIYIIASETYATQGIYKIGRTKSMAMRMRNHNSDKIIGDKYVILAEFAVQDEVLVEHIIHAKLIHLRVKGETEIFMAPFQELKDEVQVIVDNDAVATMYANAAVDVRYALEQEEFKSSDWMRGIPEETFGPQYYQPSEVFTGKISVSDMDDEGKLDVARSAIASYIKSKFNIDVSLPTDAKKVISPKIDIKWDDPLTTVKSMLQRGECSKIDKQSAE